MGTQSMFKRHAMTASGTNMQARAIGAGAYAARSAGSAAQKDIAASIAATKAGLQPGKKTAASNAPGPKKV